MRVGVLALQGDFAKHGEMLQSLGIEVQEVRTPQDLRGCEGLILPGGESTVMVRQIEFISLWEPLLAFAQEKPVFGTCAGLILMSHQVQHSSFKTLELLDVETMRNAYGRQVESFEASIVINLPSSHDRRFPAYFIRAPRIRSCSKGVDILAQYQGEPVLVRQGFHLGACFHPELTSDPVIHAYFIRMIKENTH
jgi:5'-phosphate synthase pdxT subunit